MTDEVVPIPSMDLDGVAEFINSGKAKKILVMCGAGISVAAGIPDFRTPGTGLYAQVQKYGLPTPQSLFSLDYFREHPDAFYSIAGEMKLWPDVLAPTHIHHFIRLLQDRGILLKCCTQNIDCLERTAGVTDSMLLEAHGSFAGSSCIDCKRPFDTKELRKIVEDGGIPRCELCAGLVKPNVVFFGESLPESFISFLTGKVDADLLIVIGTSLKVNPFAALTDSVGPDVPRVVINNQRVGATMFFRCDEDLTPDSKATTSDSEDEYLMQKLAHRAAMGRKATRDILIKGDCQEIIRRLAELLGMGEDLERLYQEGCRKVASLSGSTH